MLWRANATDNNKVEYALENFNLEVESGQTYALLGPNGAGKTTLMRVITRRLRGYAGSVAIFGDKASEATLV